MVMTMTMPTVLNDGDDAHDDNDDNWKADAPPGGGEDV